ncbi:hypothetical protein BGZ61DRAFT_540112 [Ilyonectria robusta]|uniref:uncharacterized protein n=1 Tax=Ilyonectria robusta TaxID=1079257 RepID=UPI001E8D12E3|nr:uncharacterized protein BGZ61DRAFT_540112 [Ilyonectria robusta]KAH8659540.1 hypothetical protein BGZ61DRAFT_540112 [Ilyonectria robusta]
MAAQSLADWLSSIPYHQPTPETPPPPDANVNAVRWRKRRRLNSPTPKPSNYTNHRLSAAHRSKDALFSYSPNASFLECSDRSVRINELTALHDPPPALRDLLDTMEKIISSGGGVVATWRRYTWHFSDERHLVGPTPLPKAVLRILAAAAECSTNGHAEADLNASVHQRVLELALQSPDQEEFKHHINFLISSTANILPEYAATSTLLRMIDFCIYIDPAFDQSSAASKLQSAITNLRRHLPGAVLNHTEYRPLRERPIALSIKTKKTGAGWDGAMLQLVVWQSAHWSFLRQLVEGQRREKIAEEGARTVQQVRQGTVEDSYGDADSTETNSQGQAEPQEPEIAVQPYPLPDFIPGIIVQGHDWHLVITTTDGQQTQLRQKVTIGTTNTSKGIYQIVYALQILRQWAQDVYWPWLRAPIVAF